MKQVHTLKKLGELVRATNNTQAHGLFLIQGIMWYMSSIEAKWKATILHSDYIRVQDCMVKPVFLNKYPEVQRM